VALAAFNQTIGTYKDQQQAFRSLIEGQASKLSSDADSFEGLNRALS
jgi:hypothetical protein